MKKYIILFLLFVSINSYSQINNRMNNDINYSFEDKEQVFKDPNIKDTLYIDLDEIEMLKGGVVYQESEIIDSVTIGVTGLWSSLYENKKDSATFTSTSVTVSSIEGADVVLSDATSFIVGDAIMFGGASETNFYTIISKNTNTITCNTSPSAEQNDVVYKAYLASLDDYSDSSYVAKQTNAAQQPAYAYLGTDSVSLRYDGIDDRFDVSNPNFTNKSVSFWFKTATDARMGILGGFLGANMVYFTDDDEGIGFNSQFAGNDLNDNKWHHVVVTTNDNSSIYTIYIDNLIVLKTSSSDWRTGDKAVIGANASTLAYTLFFNGYIDDIISYNRVISHRQASAMYKASRFYKDTYSDTHGLYAYSGMSGGLTTRFRVTGIPVKDLIRLGSIFSNYGYKATFTLITPAQYKNDESYKTTLRNLQNMGHDVGYTQDVSATLVHLYDSSLASYFLSLDSELSDSLDSYGNPASGINEIITVGASKYMALNSEIRYVSDSNIIVRAVHGTDSIYIENIPESSSLYGFMIYMPDTSIVPEAIRNKWVFCGVPNSNTISIRRFPIRIHEYFTLNNYAGSLFSNTGNATFLTKVGLCMAKTGEDYSSYLTQPEYTNHKNQRARYYEYLHAKMAFDSLGLDAPLTVGEPRSYSTNITLSAKPLSDLGYTSGTVDPVRNGHTFFMPESTRYMFSTESFSAGDVLEESGRVNSINFNPNATKYTADQALSRIADNYNRNRWLVERQTTAYSADDLLKIDTLLNLCRQNTLPVLSLAQLSPILYDRTYSNSINIFPALNKDIDLDSVPDGFRLFPEDATFNKDSSFISRNTTGSLGRVNWLGGINPDSCKVYVNAKGQIGDTVIVQVAVAYYTFPNPYTRFGADIAYQDTKTFTCVLNDTDWKRYSLGKFYVPEYAYFCNVILSTQNSDLIKVGQIEIYNE